MIQTMKWKNVMKNQMTNPFDRILATKIRLIKYKYNIVVRNIRTHCK